jgi:hypothetical protein
MVCLAPDTAIVEIKKGPYDAAADKFFASWAPEEGIEDAVKREREWADLFQPA